MFEPSASEPPAVQCSVVEEHTNGVVHLHGVVIATRDINGPPVLILGFWDAALWVGSGGGD